MSPSPVRAISAVGRTETTSGVARMILGVWRPMTTMSLPPPPGIETSGDCSCGAGSDCGLSGALGGAGAACARAADGATSADEMSNRLASPNGFDIIKPPICNPKGAGRCLPATPRPRSISSRQVVGSEVQAPLLPVPKSAVELLQVQLLYQLSFASLTAPI